MKIHHPRLIGGFALGLGLLLGSAPARGVNTASNYYVALSGSDANPGSKAHPFLTIQHALNVAQSSDGVFVAPGTYSGPGNIDLDFEGKALHLRGLSSQAASVVIDCQQAGRGFHFHSGETRAAVVNRLTITHGHAPDGITDPTTGNGTAGADGGGMLIEGGSSPTIEQCTFSNNSAGNGGSNDSSGNFQGGNGGNGGALRVIGGSPAIRNCLFMGNQAGAGAGSGAVGTSDAGNAGGGGAIEISDSIGTVIQNCSFSGNSAGNNKFVNGGDFGGDGGDGGAIEVNTCTDLVIRACNFSSNSAGDGGTDNGLGSDAGRGGAIDFQDSSSTVIQSTFTGNSAGSAGSTGSNLTAHDGGQGGGVSAINSSLILHDCDFISNQTGLGYSTIVNGANGGKGGGLALNEGAASQIIRCRFLTNSTAHGSGAAGLFGAAGNGGNGGGLSLNANSSVVADCFFEGDNTGIGGSGFMLTSGDGGDGGGLSVEGGSNPVITNCVIAANTTGAGGSALFAFPGNGGNGGGVHVNVGSRPAFVNCTVAFNSTGAGGVNGSDPSVVGSIGKGGGLDCDNDLALFANCIFYFDTDASGAVSEILGVANLSYSEVQGSFLDRGDPLFARKPGTNGGADLGDLHLQAGSPCIDVGNNAALPHGDVKDLAGNPRIVNKIVDLGAYEFQH